MTTPAERDTDQIRAEVARVGRMLAEAGLVEAFGHVSARTPSGFVITSVDPMLEATWDKVIVVESDGTPLKGPVHRVPLETPMHAAIYAARPDIGGICRGHPPFTVAWGVGSEPLPIYHGLGGLAGDPVVVHDDVQLVTDIVRGQEVAVSLGNGSCLILRSNGALAVGHDPVEAATRLFFLEERARVASAAVTSSATATSNWGPRFEHSAAELARAVTWFSARFGKGPADDAIREQSR